MGWRIEAVKELREVSMNIENPFRGKENDIQKQIIDNKIIKAKYNRRYKCTITDNRKSRYLWKENIWRNT